MSENKDFFDQGHGQDDPGNRLTPQEEPEMRSAIFDLFKKESGKDPKVQVFDIGETVLCDQCNEDYTNSEESGGFIFGSHAYCPKCAEESLPRIKSHNECMYIKAYCPVGQSFKDFVIGYCGSKRTITVTTFDKDLPKVKCRFCGKEIEGFKDTLSQKEFKITGMCQKCQDDIF